MTSRSCVATVLILAVAVASGLAQSRNVVDPVSGRWSGVFRVAEREIPIGLELRYDGTREVTGTLTGMPRPGGVKSGTFDVAKAALTLGLGIDGDDAVLIVLEGTVKDGRATGTIDTENGKGTFEVRKAP